MLLYKWPMLSKIQNDEERMRGRILINDNWWCVIYSLSSLKLLLHPGFGNIIGKLLMNFQHVGIFLWIRTRLIKVNSSWKWIFFDIVEIWLEIMCVLAAARHFDNVNSQTQNEKSVDFDMVMSKHRQIISVFFFYYHGVSVLEMVFLDIREKKLKLQKHMKLR